MNDSTTVLDDAVLTERVFASKLLASGEIFTARLMAHTICNGRDLDNMTRLLKSLAASGHLYQTEASGRGGGALKFCRANKARILISQPWDDKLFF